MEKHQDHLIQLFRDSIPGPLRERVRRVVVFGSCARGEAAPDSDLDVAVIVNSNDPSLEQALDDAAYQAMYDTDFRTILSLKVFAEEDFNGYVARGFSFYRHIVEQGIAV